LLEIYAFSVNDRQQKGGSFLYILFITIIINYIQYLYIIIVVILYSTTSTMYFWLLGTKMPFFRYLVVYIHPFWSEAASSKSMCNIYKNSIALKSGTKTCLNFFS